MDRLRVAVALLILAGYFAVVIYAASHPNYNYPPGSAVIVGAAVTFLLGGPAIREGVDRFRRSKEDD